MRQRGSKLSPIARGTLILSVMLLLLAMTWSPGLGFHFGVPAVFAANNDHIEVICNANADTHIPTYSFFFTSSVDQTFNFTFSVDPGGPKSFHGGVARGWGWAVS